MARAKICGLTRAADLRAAVQAGADAVGLISRVDVETPRELDAERAAVLADSVPPFVSAVLVTMPAEPGEAVKLAETVEPDALQLHAEFDGDEVATVREETGLPVLPVVSVDEAERARDLATEADALLVDSVAADGGGGTGKPHDWDRTADIAREVAVPVVLAGGLTPGNVAEAVRTVDPYAVDVASGVEREGGVKDHEAVQAFVDAATRVVVP